MRVLALGAGYTAMHLLRHFPTVDTLLLSRRSEELRADGLPLWNPTDDAQPWDAILDTVPALISDGGLGQHPWREAIDSILERQPSTPLIHISSTSVLGGARRPAADPPEQFDEFHRPAPDEERGLLRLELEQAMRTRYPQLRILRAAGIYGPGRSVADQFLRGDLRRLEAGNVIVSRIHVHDLCRLALAWIGLSRQRPDLRLIHAVDCRPCSNRELFEFLERALPLELPDGPWRHAAASGRAVVSRYRDEALPGGLCYPDYRSGMLASVLR
ncbi:MAG: sugar nucleotide-binding protein [Leptospirales bacterium]|nr:sugar nucleotide-binding protein [Leptospirales bacterium]